jgi:hypothetical protein
MGFSLKANKKTIEGTMHVDRDAQFQQIYRSGKAFDAAGKPMISADCKKKELIGTFKNNGREWQAKGHVLPSPYCAELASLRLQRFGLLLASVTCCCSLFLSPPG